MNNFCLLNNMAAMSFKVLLQQGISILVLALFRNIVLFLMSLAAYYTFFKGCRKQNTEMQLPEMHYSIPIRLQNTDFIKAQVRSIFGTISFLLFNFNLSILPITIVLIVFQTNPLSSAILGFLINRERVSLCELIAMLASFSCVIMVCMARSD